MRTSLGKANLNKGQYGALCHEIAVPPAVGPSSAKTSRAAGVSARSEIVIVSPQATLAFELWVVGDTSLKTGWVGCQHGAGGAGWYGVFYKCLKILRFVKYPDLGSS